jgi:hypothetical protein
MSYGSSMQYTIGTAVERAREHGHVVELLVEGNWVSGLVVANDGLGVVLEGSADEHCIVRLERVSAVRVSSGSPFRRLSSVPQQTPRTADGAMPMPAPASEPGQTVGI